MPSLAEFMDAVTDSALPGLDRWLLTIHAMRADPDTLAIAHDEQLSLSDQADMAGVHRSTVIRHLAALESGGWLDRRRPSKRDQRRYHARTAYALTIPGASRITPPALGADGDRLDAARAEPRGAVRRGLGALRRSRSTDGQTSSGDYWDDPAVIEVARAELAAAFPGRDIAPGAARAAVRQITEGQTIRRSVTGYVRQSVRDNPRKFMPAGSPPPVPPPARGHHADPEQLADLLADTRRQITRGTRAT